MPLIIWMLRILLLLMFPWIGLCCCADSRPTSNFFSEKEFYVNGVSPNRCPITGGARITISGAGFNTHFFEGGNYVYIGNGRDGWVECDVIEGACTVECGGPRTLVCDTRPWPYQSSLRQDSGWLDIKVMIQIPDFANEFQEVILSNGFYYHGLNYAYSPKLKSISPRAGSSEDAIQLQGFNWGYWIQDYRIIFVGRGRPPQGGNVNTGELNTHALCRPGTLNTARNPDEPFSGTSTISDTVVNKEDFGADPIAKDVFFCGLGDFEAGSYNVSVYMDNDKRGASSTFIAGLSTVYDEDGYWDAHLLRYDGHGVLHELQYYPHIDNIFPEQGSFGGGTEVTILGGGFSMEEAKNFVLVDGKRCIVTFSTLELIRCNTSAYTNESQAAHREQSKLSTQTLYSTNEIESQFGGGHTLWMSAVDIVGNWSLVKSTYGQQTIQFFSDQSDPSSKGQAWITFAPPGRHGVANVTGIYEFLLRLPVLSSSDAPCLIQSTNASVVLRHAGGYSSVKLNESRYVRSDDDRFIVLSVGNYTLLAGATVLLTLDNSGTGKTCVAVGTQTLMRFHKTLEGRGCTNYRAENFDATATIDDNSCLYLGARGISSRSWPYMKNSFVLDDWYPVKESETWSTGDFCVVPSSSAAGWNATDCWHDKCEQHQQCGNKAFCCITDDHHGCSPVWDISTNKQGWKLLFRQNTETGGAWPKGVWRKNASDMFSILDELENYRRPSDGSFEFKMCWPNSGFTECTHWAQSLSPQLNPKETNMYANCIDCPYADDTNDFKGLIYDGNDAIMDADEDESYHQIGVYSTTLRGPRLKNDIGVSEYPSEVTLWVRPDTNGPACISCYACYDEDGRVRQSEYSCPENPTHPLCVTWLDAILNGAGQYTTDSISSTYWAPACPDFCLNEEVIDSPRASIVLAPHQMVLATNNLKEMDCFASQGVAAYTDEIYNSTICPGHQFKRMDEIPAIPDTFRLGGSVHRAFFVAPVTANYTFHLNADDGGEVWLSPDGDPRSARRILSSRPEHEDATKSSRINEKWTCIGTGDNRVCFRYFPLIEDHEYAQTVCAGYGARLANPKSREEQATIVNLAAANVWIGLSDLGSEGKWYYSDGIYAGSAYDGTVHSGWTWERWGGAQPDDDFGIENCAEMQHYHGFWSDLSCTGEVRATMCEIRNGGINVRETEPIPMVAGDVRYFESLFYNSFGDATSLVTLTVNTTVNTTSTDSVSGLQFLASEVIGISAEYFREIRSNSPSVEVIVNGLSSSCSSDECSFQYSEQHTPTVESVSPAAAVPGTELTLVGTRFSPLPSMNYVKIGGAECIITNANTTFIICTIPTIDGTAGTFPVEVVVYNLGIARHDNVKVEHTVLMRIDTINPANGSLLGGDIVTITGVGFARFGLHNRVTLNMYNGTKNDEYRLLQDSRYSDDWVWGRGYLAASNKTGFSTATVTELRCVPRTLKNRECAYSTEDSGYQCTIMKEWAYSGIRTRERAEWFDFSNPTYIECVVETLSTPLVNFSVADVNISIVNSTTIINSEALEEDLQMAKRNFNCETLSHCQKLTDSGRVIGWFGEDYVFNGASSSRLSAYMFSEGETPIISRVSPKHGLPGQLIEIHGYNLAAGKEVTDRTWYLSEFGFYYQPYTATITVGTYECKLFFHNDTLIRCHVVYGEMYVPHEVEVSVFGKGRALSIGNGVVGRALNFTFALRVYDISPKAGSLAGGTILTFATSSLTSGSDLGRATYDVRFVADESQAISKYIAKYLGLKQGLPCTVRTSGEYFIDCVTRAVSGEPYESRTSSIWSDDGEAWRRASETRDLWLVGEWNREELYSQCKNEADSEACQFTYERRYTPLMMLNRSADAHHHLRKQKKWENETKPKFCTGDRLVLTQPMNYLDLSNTNNTFDWRGISAEDISWTISNVSLERITLVVTNSTGRARLSGTISNLTMPTENVSSELYVNPFGWGVIAHGSMSIVPVISSISHSNGSMAGGTRITITGRGFSSIGLQSLVVGGKPCEDIVVDENDGRTIWCVTAASASEGWGVVSATFNNVSTICDVNYIHSCSFKYSYNSTPEVVSINPKEGYYKHPDTITITGRQFAAAGNIVSLGYQKCATVKENRTQIECTVPRHVGGTYKITVENPKTGFALGSQLWFRFHSGIRVVTPNTGSIYFGQVITIAGYGFAPKAAVRNVSATSVSRRRLLSTNSTIINASSIPAPQPSAEPSSQPSLAPTYIHSAPPTRLPSLMPTDAPTVTSIPSTRPSVTPTITPTIFPSTLPSIEPSPLPTLTLHPTSNRYAFNACVASALPLRLQNIPLPLPTPLPTVSTLPSAVPSLQPSSIPTLGPTMAVGTKPSNRRLLASSPTEVPSLSPSVVTMPPATQQPTFLTLTPSLLPSLLPSPLPIFAPTAMPSLLPTLAPTPNPTLQPTSLPTTDPTAGPSLAPSASPSPVPTAIPSLGPSGAPTLEPTSLPTMDPTNLPTVEPSSVPTTFAFCYEDCSDCGDWLKGSCGKSCNATTQACLAELCADFFKPSPVPTTPAPSTPAPTPLPTIVPTIVDIEGSQKINQEYNDKFNTWRNEGSAAEHPFDLEILEATFDQIVAKTTLLGYRRMGASDTDGWLREITIDIVRDGDGSITPGNYKKIYDKNGASTLSNLFDGDDTTRWSAGSTSTWPSGDWVVYVAEEAFLLTDYQVVWSGAWVGCPTAWLLYGYDTFEEKWELLHTVNTMRRESANREYLNMTVDNPGYYASYQWYFIDGVTRSEHNWQTNLREIILNPGGAARHYGRVQSPQEELVKESFVAGYTNVAFGKTANQVSTYSNRAASRAIDGSMQRYYSSQLCSCTKHETNPYWYVDLGTEMTIDHIAVIGRNPGENNYKLSDGTYVGVSSAECWKDVGCTSESSGVTVCGILSKNSWNANEQYHLSCKGKQANNTITSGALGRYVFVWGSYVDYLSLCEVLAMGSPLEYDTANTTFSYELSSTPYRNSSMSNTTNSTNITLHPSFFPTPGPSSLPTPGPTTARHVNSVTANVRYLVVDNDRLFLTWDAALDKCQRFRMAPATVRSESEQAALAAAFYNYHKKHASDHDNMTETLQYSWLGGIYENGMNSDDYGWYWVDSTGAENLAFDYWNYTNWEDSDSMPTIGSLSFMYVNAISMKWGWASSFTDVANSFVCEERTTLPFPTFRRIFESPMIESVNPSIITENTLLTITGKNFNASGSLQTLNISLGDYSCLVQLDVLNDTFIFCKIIAGVRAGVYPVRVTSAFGAFGPAKSFLVTATHEVFNVTPSSGSYGGGTIVTITGVNFPTNMDYVNVMMTAPKQVAANLHNYTNSTFLCIVKNTTRTAIVCETEGVSGARQLFTKQPREEIEKLTTRLDAKTWLMPNGDELRIVSQASWDDFSDRFTAGIHVVNGDTGTEYIVPGSEFHYPGYESRRIAALAYDPISRTVVKRFVAQFTDITSGLTSFLEELSSDYILVIVTHSNRYYSKSEELTEALKACGGSDVWDYRKSSAGTDAYSYILIGRCNIGLTAGHSSALGYEYKADVTGLSLEIQTDPLKIFEMAMPSSPGVQLPVFTYDEARTPFVTSISRRNGTTAGGTLVHIYGEGFVPENTTVYLAGVLCATESSQIGSYRDKYLCDWDGVDCNGIGVHNENEITCLSGVWDYNGDAFKRNIVVYVHGKGNAITSLGVWWSYMDLWSSTTTWGGNNPPVSGDSVVITYGEYIVLDVSPPELYLLTIQGTLEFSHDVGDLALNASYIVLQYGRLIVGTKDEPFTSDATITLVGQRTAYELPVYGAKTVAVRTGELILHGRPRISWTKLAETAHEGNTTIVVQDDTDWEVGDHLFLSSTEYNQYQAEELYITDISADGRVVQISKPLLNDHWGEGWVADDGSGDSIEAYRASVGLLTRNIVIQGDHVYSKAQTFGVQIVLSTESTTGDNPLLGQFSNVEVREAGQGMKIGKYPIHFHLVGNVSESYIKNCSVHNSFNRAIAIHGVDALLVEYNVVFDTRGHTIFLEDGTERFNIIRYNLVGVVRPVWSLLMVDQTPSCFWIVNPANYIYGNVAAGSSRHGFWMRSLPTPDGISGQTLTDASSNRCPNYAELLQFEDNTAHSTGGHGLMLSNYFPLQDGYFCPAEEIPAPATFKKFSSFHNRGFGVWGEFLVDIHFDHFKLQGTGFEAKYLNGRSAKFATSYFSHMLFVGSMYDAIMTNESTPRLVAHEFDGRQSNIVEFDGSAINLPGIGSQIKIVNASFHNYRGMIAGCTWCVFNRGGYEMEFWNVSMHNIDHIVDFSHSVAGILVDGDGSLGVGPGGHIVPPTGQFRNNPNCTIEGGRYASCTTAVRRVNVGLRRFTSPFYNTRTKVQFPFLTVNDITNEELTLEWDKWTLEEQEASGMCSSKISGDPYDYFRRCGSLHHFSTPKGPTACFEQAPIEEYSFMAAVGRRYLIVWNDKNRMRATADIDISVLKMRPDEHIIFQFTQRPPLYPRIPVRATVLQGPVELWGENAPEWGAWSPPPNIPSYTGNFQDHSGDALTDSCASGVYMTPTYPDSCIEGRSFSAPELHDDPQVVTSGYNPQNYFQRLKATGTTANGGMLHPLDSKVICLAVTSINNGAQGYGTAQYFDTYLEECGTADNENDGIYLAGTWKYGWSYEEEAFTGNECLALNSHPYFCLDIERDESDDEHGGSPLNHTGARFFTYMCDDTRATQRWYFKASTREIVNRGTGRCIGWTSGVGNGKSISLQDCDGTYTWDQDFWFPHNTSVAIHGSFYFDPYRNKYNRGVVQPASVHNLTSSSSQYKVISSVPAASSFYDYTVWNTSVLSVVVAGNSTLSIAAHKCPAGGCLPHIPDPSSAIATFFWSDNSSWTRLNSSVPCDEDIDSNDEEKGFEVCWSIVIWDGWTVILDVETPFLNKLEVRGTLIAQHNANKTIGINANIIDIKGGRVIFGNTTHPFEGKYGHITLHGDMYKHGKDCDHPIDIGDEGCYKKIKVNGELSVHGVQRNVTVKLREDAWSGTKILYVDKAVDWVHGDEIVISSSDVTGDHERHLVDSISLFGNIVTLQTPIMSDHIGTAISFSLDSEDITVDGRSTVSLLSRNIEIRGGYDFVYDYISGVGPDKTEYGATIHVLQGYYEAKHGWLITDPGYELFGRWWFPAGEISSMSWVRFRACGKQSGRYAVKRFPVMNMSGSPSAELEMHGVVMTEPLSGMIFDRGLGRSDSSVTHIDLTLIEFVSIGYGTILKPRTGVTHKMYSSIMFGGEECAAECPPMMMLLVGGGNGTLHLKDNLITGGVGGIVIEGSCSEFKLWENNLAMGNGNGYLISGESSCANLRLIPYRNSLGVAAGGTYLSNVIAAENGVGVAPVSRWAKPPTVQPNIDESTAANAQLKLFGDSIIVGVLPVNQSGDVRSSSCQRWSEGFKLGGLVAGKRGFDEYAYSGFAASGPHIPTRGTEYGMFFSDFKYTLQNIVFYGFSGTDSCGRKNVAIGNEMAGDGEGGPDRGGYSALYGKATCYPIVIRQSNFTNVPTFARMRFSENTVQDGLCSLYDDGSLVGIPLDEDVEYHQLISSVPHEWPPDVLRECIAWADLGYTSAEVGAGSCLWWIKFYSDITAAINNAARRGVLKQGWSGTSFQNGECIKFPNDDDNEEEEEEDTLDTNALLCSGMDYVWLQTHIPTRIISGSELLYGPVGYVHMYDANMGSSSFAGDRTTVDIYRDYADPRNDQVPPQTGENPNKFKPRNERYTHPYLARLVNRGYYRIEYTGDITAFHEGFIEFQLHNAALDKPLFADDFTLVLDIKFLKAVNVAFYYNGLQVRQSPRRDMITLDAVAGTNYLDPVSKVLSIVVKGTDKPVRMRQLDVVSVEFGVAVTFAEFFEDNLIDPNACREHYADQIPPSYSASYDPDNGNIVRSNLFVRNLANVLKINPGRIRVTNIVPGNSRRRLRDRYRSHNESFAWRSRELLSNEESEIAVEFEVSATDPCEGVACVNGDCNVDGECECNQGWTGLSCNVTKVNCTKVENLLTPSCNVSVPTVTPSFSPSSVPPTSPSTMNISMPIMNSTNASVSTSSPSVAPTVAQSIFDELISVASILSEASASGGLDTGYDITEVYVVLPDDVCGVSGGDGTTCDDACGVANGDNSTCADVCGVPYGDGMSCLGNTGSFFICETGSDGSLNEKQAVLLRGYGNGFSGSYRLSFNGQVTAYLSVLASAADVKIALEDLPTVGTLEILINQTFTSATQLSGLDILIEFSRNSGIYPSHYGPMPKILVDTSSLDGVSFEGVLSVCSGKHPSSYSFEEQLVVIDGDLDLNGSFSLVINATGEMTGSYGTSQPIFSSDSATAITAALTSSAWSPASNSFAITSDFFEIFEVNSTAPFDVKGGVNHSHSRASKAAWLVRWYLKPQSSLLRLTNLGDMLRMKATNIDMYSGSSVSVVEIMQGMVPEGAMPVSATAFSAEAGAAAVEATSNVEVSTLDYIEIEHVCGDGILTTAEDCDDGANSPGDGCSANCTIEDGFVCTNTLGYMSACSVPEKPTFYFSSTLFGPFDEGSNGTVLVHRAGFNGSTNSVDFRVASSTAYLGRIDNDRCAISGDFNFTSGTLTFQSGQTSTRISVPLLRDGIYEQSTVKYERLLVLLSNPIGGQIDTSRSSTYISIRDLDSANYTAGYCFTASPSNSPTAYPSLIPTPSPTTPNPSPLPTSVPTSSPTSTPMPSVAPTITATPTISVQPTPSPTLEPSCSPTALPSLSPSAIPSRRPTKLPSMMPSRLPTHIPSTIPTRVPTLDPSNRPTSVPSGPPTLTPTTEDTASAEVSMSLLATAAHTMEDENNLKSIIATSISLDVKYIKDFTMVSSLRSRKRRFLLESSYIWTVAFTAQVPLSLVSSASSSSDFVIYIHTTLTSDEFEIELLSVIETITEVSEVTAEDATAGATSAPTPKLVTGTFLGMSRSSIFIACATSSLVILAIVFIIWRRWRLRKKAQKSQSSTEAADSMKSAAIEAATKSIGQVVPVIDNCSAQDKEKDHQEDEGAHVPEEDAPPFEEVAEDEQQELEDLSNMLTEVDSAAIVKYIKKKRLKRAIKRWKSDFVKQNGRKSSTTDYDGTMRAWLAEYRKLVTEDRSLKWLEVTRKHAKEPRRLEENEDRKLAALDQKLDISESRFQNAPPKSRKTATMENYPNVKAVLNKDEARYAGHQENLELQHHRSKIALKWRLEQRKSNMGVKHELENHKEGHSGQDSFEQSAEKVKESQGRAAMPAIVDAVLKGTPPKPEPTFDGDMNVVPDFTAAILPIGKQRPREKKLERALFRQMSSEGSVSGHEEAAARGLIPPDKNPNVFDPGQYQESNEDAARRVKLKKMIKKWKNDFMIKQSRKPSLADYDANLTALVNEYSGLVARQKGHLWLEAAKASTQSRTTKPNSEE